MVPPADTRTAFSQLVESRIRQSTHDRIRNLKVIEVQGRLVVRGTAPTHHARQLALHGALEMMPSDGFSTEITVARSTSTSVPIPG